MKPYTVTFLNEWNERYVLFADGISDTHANARAWIKFMKTKWYADAPDSWSLESLELVFSESAKE
jgi:hypothetical protein